VKAVALAAVFAAGILLAGTLTARGQGIETTTETTIQTATSTVHDTTTAPATTVVTTETTSPTSTTSPTTTAASSSTSSTPTWVWVALAILVAAVVGLVVALLTRRGGGGSGIQPGERRQRLDNAIATWAAQGWALESETTDSAVLRRGDERMMVGVDDAGHVTARPLGDTYR
jgi:heme exporter protein D